MYHGSWAHTSGLLRIALIPSAFFGWGRGFGDMKDGGDVCLWFVLLALLFLLVTSVRIYHSVVLFTFMLLSRHTPW